MKLLRALNDQFIKGVSKLGRNVVLLVLNVVLKHGTYRPKTRSYLIVALYYVFNSMLAVGVGCISK